MSSTTPRRERVLHMIRQERTRQIEQYGSNDDLEPGFGSTVTACPWLMPYTDESAEEVQVSFRIDYEDYIHKHDKPTWMHLIREEVAELFETTSPERTISEAIQVAALCVSMVENLLETQGEAWRE